MHVHITHIHNCSISIKTEGEEKLSKQTFIRGTIILIIAGFITRTLGFVNRIILARIMGEEGVGLYMMAFPTFLLAITLTQIGLPVAISKFIAEADAENDSAKIKRILVVSLVVTTGLSIIISIILMLFSPLMAEHLLGDRRTFYPLIVILPVLPIIAFSSVLRGYFQGKQDMRPGAYAQVIEQVVRITFIYICIKSLAPFGIEYAAMGAMLSAVLGELASLFYVWHVFQKQKPFQIRENFLSVLSKSKQTLKELMHVALPTTGSRLFGSVTLFLEPILISQSFIYIGLGATEAAKQYGIFSGYVIPLLMLPSFITYSLSVSLVPAISEALVKKQYALVEYRLQQSLRICLVTGGLAVTSVYIYARPILQIMYGNDASTELLQLMAPFFLLYYFQGPLQAALQAMDLAKAGMYNTLVGSVLKSIFIVIMATQTDMQIYGVALAYCFGVILITFLHLATVFKNIPFTLKPLEYITSLIIMLLSGFFGNWLYKQLAISPLVLKLVICLGLVSAFYGLLLFITGLVPKKEWGRFAGFRKHL